MDSNYNNMSKEELIALLLSQDKKLETMANDIKNKDDVIKNKDDVIKNKDDVIKEKNADIKKKNDALRYREKKIEKLEAEKKELNLHIEKLIAKYEDKLLDSKKFQVEKFMPSSEIIKDEDKVINELEAIKQKKTRKAPTVSFIEDLKSLCKQEVFIDYDFVDMDTSKIKPFGEDETYKIEIKPVCFEVVKIVKKKYKDKDKIYEATNNDPYPHSPLTPSLAANIIEMKFNLGVPFYRYSAYLKANGLNISEADICNYASRTMDLLNPLYDELLKTLVSTPYKVIHADETPLEVIDSNKGKCYMFVYTTSFWDKPVYIYDFNEKRTTDKLSSILADKYKGYLVCDGYVGYDHFAKEGIKIARCWVHLRRKFYDCVKVLPESNQKLCSAYKAVELIDVLFKYESDFRKRKLTASKILKERNSKNYKKAIKDIDKYIKSLDVADGSSLEKAVKYYLYNEKEFYTFLKSGYVDISNNLAERVVRPFVIARKSFMFCKTVDGAIVTGKLFSIIQTARANGLKSEQYLKYVIENINKKNIGDLLPWSINLPKELLITNKDVA